MCTFLTVNKGQKSSELVYTVFGDFPVPWGTTGSNDDFSRREVIS